MIIEIATLSMITANFIVNVSISLYNIYRNWNRETERKYSVKVFCDKSMDDFVKIAKYLNNINFQHTEIIKLSNNNNTFTFAIPSVEICIDNVYFKPVRISNNHSISGFIISSDVMDKLKEMIKNIN